MTKQPTSTKKQENSNQRKITVSRKTKNLSAFAGGAVPFEVLLDGVIVGTVALGQEISFNVNKSSHSIQAQMRNVLVKKFGGNGVQSAVLTVPAGDMEYVYSVEMKSHFGSNEVVLSEVGHCLPGNQMETFKSRESEGAKWIAEMVKRQFEEGGVCYQLLEAGAQDVYIFINRKNLEFSWTGDARNNQKIVFSGNGTAKVYKDNSVNSFSDMLKAMGGKYKYEWNELTDEFTFIDDEHQRYELLLMIHERIQELLYIDSKDVGRYRIKKQGFFW